MMLLKVPSGYINPSNVEHVYMEISQGTYQPDPDGPAETITFYAFNATMISGTVINLSLKDNKHGEVAYNDILERWAMTIASSAG